MKRFWFRQFAIAMGLLGASPALAQFPAYNTNTGPSSFPVQQLGPQLGFQQPVFQNPGQQPGSYQLTNWQESVPSVPSNGQFGNVPNPPAGHNLNGNLPSAAIPNSDVLNGYAPSGHPQAGIAHTGQPPVAPLPMAHQYAPVNTNPPMTYAQPAPAMSYNQQQTIAPGCTSCGSGPVSQGFVQHSGPATYAYSAPSIGYGYDQSCSHNRPRLLGNGLPVGAKPFFFGGGVLIFKRIDDYNRELSFNDATGATILNTRDAALNTMGGFEVMGGRYFNCGRNAIAASYWGLFPENQMVERTGAPGAYRSAIFRPIGPTSNEFQYQTGGAAAPGTDPEIYTIYDDAATHRLRRSSNFHNVEINILGFGVGCAARSFNRATAGTMFSGHHQGRGGFGGGCGAGGCGAGAYGDCGSQGCGDCGNYSCGGDCCATASRYATGPCGYIAPSCGSRLNLSWLAGVRYLQFQDTLEYAAMGGPVLGANILSYDVATRNHLVGFQVGGRADYCIGARANLYSLAKAGIFGNSASLDSRLGNQFAAAYRTGDPTIRYQFSRSANQLAFLSELGAGVGYRLTPKWSATCGYRAIVASGVATAVGNVRHQGQFVNTTGIRAQDYLVLHGLDIGALYNF